MKILVTGATGLIGSSVAARLAADGHDVVAAVRPGGTAPMAVSAVAEIDFRQATEPSAWLPHLAGVDAVVNCAGVLQDSPREDTGSVHVSGAAALFLACEQAGVRRVVHFSAIGVDRGAVSDFSDTKGRGDDVLKARELDWVILRPSVVLGRSVFGASALFRGLAALPVLPLMPDTGELQVVQLDDVVATVAFFVRPEAPARVELEVAGPQRLSMADIVAAYRRWLGWRPARRWMLPGWAASTFYGLGDLAGRLGWRPPMRGTARKEIVRGAVGDPARWSELTGIAPASLDAALKATPPTVQDRWFARLYFLKPVIFTVLPIFWIATGIISLTTGWREGIDLMVRTGAGPLSGPSVVAGALADIAVGTAIAWRPWSRYGLWGAVALCLFYAISGTILLPSLWNEPLGPLLKIWPILVLHLVALAILKER